MAERKRFFYVPPINPDADPTCRLQKPGADERVQTVDMLIERALSVEPLPNGTEFQFRDSAEEREAIETFIMEESECCPFLSFEVWIEGDALVFHMIHPAAEVASV